ncbi:MAG TPA: glycine betaine ABC transporter substrate-binding protein [Actinomycetota bacterium]|nr:glycine betaine ABC transporter substrate-binding protein [Actinomycetota bacterium]
MRKFRTTAHGAALLALALFVGACGSGVGGDDDDGGGGNGDAGGGGGEPVASQLVLGGPPECPERPFCIPGLEETYGIEFKDFKPLDVAGPLTVRALEGGEIDVALLFSTQSVIADRGWVLLEDDKGLQTAENITPVINHSVHDAAIEGLLNQISGALTTENITELNGRVEIDGEKPADVAADFLESEGISGEGESGSGNITVGAVAFAENQIVAEMYAQVLEQAGYSVKRQLDLGSREILQPALESGEIHVAPEYLGSLLLFLDPEAAASGDPQENHDLLVPLLDGKGIGILEFSEANDTNAFVVTQETADEYGLQAVSDLASES